VKADADIRFDRIGWGWIGLAVSGVIVYLLTTDIRIKFTVNDDQPQGGGIQAEAAEEDDVEEDTELDIEIEV